MTTPSPEEIRERLTLGITLQKHGRMDAAMAVYQEILSLDSRQPHVLYLLGLANQSVGKLHAAVNYVIRAVLLNPDEGEYRLGLGMLYRALGSRDAALEQLTHAARLLPASPDPHLQLGDLHLDRGHPAQAVEAFREALARDPACEAAHLDMGLCFKAMGETDIALICFKEALRLNPENPVTWVNLAHTLLLQGRYGEGWRAYEWRLRLPEMAPVLGWLPEGARRWEGEDLGGQTLLVVSEQGFGDNLQFMRYLPMLRERGGRVILSVPGSLHSLLRDTPLADQVVERTRIAALAGGFDLYCHLMSLPGLFHTTVESIPAPIPYVTPHPELLPVWRERLLGDGVKLGVVWHGKPLHAGDPYRSRSCPLPALAPLGAVAGVTLFSLQRADEGEEKGWEELPGSLAFVHLGPYLTDFDQTAAAMAELDGVISIDTAAAHLAGSMGIPCWTLLPYAPDWRWFLGRETTPWYPHMKLYRQEEPGVWETPVRRLAADLAEFVAQRRKAGG